MTAEHDHDDDHDKGLSHDLPRLAEQAMNRRRVLGLFGALTATGALAACGAESETAQSADSAAGPGSSGPPAASGSTAAVADGEIPEETAGPYPGDGSNGANVLNQSGVVRSDIRSSFAGASAVAAGIPLTLRMKVYDLSGEEATTLAGAAVYVWHCDRDGNYSMYSGPVEAENYLRGVQIADEDGYVEFTTIFPGCYAGRWPHIHFEVYPSEDDATSASNRLRTSQLAFPEDVCAEAYTAEGYEQSVTNLSAISLETDNVFSDGWSLQLAAVSGDSAAGYTATLNVPI